MYVLVVLPPEVTPSTPSAIRVALTGAMLKPHDSVPHCMPMVGGVQQAFSPAQVLLVEDVRGGPRDDGHGEAGNPREQYRGLVEARVCKVVEDGACTGGNRLCWNQVKVSFSHTPDTAILAAIVLMHVFSAP